MTKKRWLAVYVNMHHEKKVRSRLSALGIENFLPVQTEIRQWSDRKKKIEKILIPMMIFVRVDTEEQRIVITQPSVIRYLVLRGEHSPTVIPDEQMEKFRFMLDFSDKPIDFNTENFVPGEKRSEEHTSELQSRPHLVCRLLLEKKKKKKKEHIYQF